MHPIYITHIYIYNYYFLILLLLFIIIIIIVIIVIRNAQLQGDKTLLILIKDHMEVS